MPTNQPNSAPIADAPRQTDDLNAPAVLHDGTLDQPPGGGGLGRAGDTHAAAGAAARGSSIDAELPHGGGDALAEAEARTQAAAAEPPEPGHVSR